MEVKKNVLHDEAGRINLRLIVLVSIILSGMVVAVLYFPPLPISAKESTSGDIAFVDSAGNALTGAIGISGAGMPGEYDENVNSVSWDNVPNASIYFNAFDAKNLSVNLWIGGDSPQSKVMIENYGIDKPTGVNVLLPGIPVKYVEVNATNVSFIEAEVYIQYTDKELEGQDEETLSVYFYDGANQTWSELPASIDAANNTLSTVVNSFSVFAVSARDARVPDKIEIHDAREIPVLSDIKTYDEARALKKAAKTTSLLTGDVPDRGEFEVDALATKNVAVKLKLNKVNRGKVILDDLGKWNPVSVLLQGRVVKYVEIGASGISYSSADITIRYDESELNGGNENDLTIYHWNGEAWEALPTTVDFTNRTLTATVTSLSPFGVATDVTYYLENNATGQSIGADGNTGYEASGTIIGTIPYKNLLKSGAMGVQENISQPVSAGQTYEIFRFYLPFNYSVDTLIAANASYKITWVTSASTTDTVNVSLIVYNPSNGEKTTVGSAQNTTTGGGTATVYTNTMNNPQYTVAAGSRLVVQINTTATADGISSLYFNDAASSYINVAETAIGAAPYITAWHNNKTSDQSTSIGINTSEAVMFSATANQTITSWNWYKDNTLQSSTFDNFTTSWGTPGSYRIDLNATSDNGTSNTVTWFVTVTGVSLPNITSWSNNRTSDQSTAIIINPDQSIRFNATANQTITMWSWLKDNTNQNNNFDNFTTMWTTPGTYNVSVNATSSNGASNTVTWNIDVAGNLIVQGSLIDTVERPLNASIRTTGPDDILINSTSGNSFNQEVPENGFIQFDANGTKQVSVRFKMIGDSRDSRVILDDYGRNSPVASALPGKEIKYVNISAINVSFDIAKISIYYTNAELGSEDENSLVIYHWNNAAWEPLLTEIDEINNTLTATTTSLSPFAVSAVGGLQTLRVTTNRYTVFAPFYTPTQTGYNEDNSSFTFAAGALVIDTNGYPLASTNINYYIYSGGGVLKKSGTVATNGNGIAFFSYNTFREFTTSTDTDFGLWTIKAERADNISINGIARVNINPLGRGGCSKDVCHHSPDDVNADSRVPLTSSPRSPYSDNFGMNPTKSMAYAAHVYKAATHGVSSSSSCNNCHTGTDRDPASTSINSPWGVHKNLSCTDCHKNPTTWPITIPDCYSSGCHPRSNNNLTSTSTLAMIEGVVNASIYSTTSGSTVVPYTVHNGSQYGNTTGVPCWICHGPMHNITKPDPLTANTNNITEYTQCLFCHNAYQRHNSSVNCTVCHSQDIHAIRIFAQNATYVKGKTNAARGNCTSCHQNSSFMSALLTRPRAGSYSGKIPQVQKPLNHSNDPGAGMKWNSTPGYWNPDSTVTACKYCHGNTLHNNTALGRPSLFRGNNTVNSTISVYSSWCASCHWQGYESGTRTYTDTVSTYNFPAEQLLIPPEITGNLTYGANQSKPDYYDHSNLPMDDASCKSCHGSLTRSTTITGFQHNIGVGTLGGADCIACHDVGGPAGEGKLVNFSAMNDTSAIHKNLNSGVATNLSNENKKCWACHGNGSEPKDHPSNYKTPYRCEDCHVPGTGQNLNFTPQYILNVTQHYWNSSNISTLNVTSCYACHNRTEMMVGLDLDPDGSSSVYSGSNGGSNSSSHYGKKRDDIAGMDTTSYCNYCHNTSTNNATFYVSDFNNTISNHSERPGTPLCTACHNSGRLHDSALVKPASDDAYCSACHGLGGSASTNNKMTHKTLYCTECHANSSSVNSAGKDIHAIKYLTQSNTFTVSNSSAVDCVTCHQTSTVDSSLSGFSAFKIANPMHHSDNASNGSVWGSYWTTPQTACIYCHNNTLHNSEPLGRILQWSPDYMMYGSIGSNFLCSDCHYSGDSNYTQMSNAFAGLLIPPEITNGTNWKGIFTNYSNHSSPYDDQSCSGCHGSLLGIGANMSEFLHRVKAGIIETGSGTNNASCISCHDINSSSSNHWINNSDMNKGVHADLNKNATNSTGVSAENKKCWGCHDANGSQPVNDMGSRYKNPYKCYDCHNATGKPYANVSNAPDVSEHFRGGLEIKAAAGASDNSSSCVVCHNLAEMKVTYTESDIYNSNYSLASHYGRNRTSDALRQGISTNCSYCHQNESTVFITAMANISNRSIADHSNYTSNPTCTQCHNTGWIHNSTLTRTAFTLPNSTFCLSCHGNNGTGGTNYTQAVTGYKEKHDNTVDCTECHLNTSEDIHPVKYLQPDASYSTNNYSAVNCVSCHQDTVYLNLSETPPKIPNPMHHSDKASNGTRWNSTGYWVSNNTLTSCIYCHNDTRHRAAALGRPDEWKGDNIINSSITNQSNWCASCHWQGYVSGEKTYSFAVSAFISAKLPVPPEITNGSYAPRDMQGYYNHSIADYSDSMCKNCHGKSLSANAYMSEFTHNITTPSCTNCHYYYEYMESVNRTEKFVNQSMFETSTHGSLRCEDCHTKGHKNIGARKACEDCHAVQQDPKNETERHNITSDPWNYSISGVSGSAVNLVDCTICHDAGLYSNATSTYNYTEEKDCDYCHKYPDSTYP